MSAAALLVPPPGSSDAVQARPPAWARAAAAASGAGVLAVVLLGAGSVAPRPTGLDVSVSVGAIGELDAAPVGDLLDAVDLHRGSDWPEARTRITNISPVGLQVTLAAPGAAVPDVDGLQVRLSADGVELWRGDARDVVAARPRFHLRSYEQVDVRVAVLPGGVDGAVGGVLDLPLELSVVGT